MSRSSSAATAPADAGDAPATPPLPSKRAARKAAERARKERQQDNKARRKHNFASRDRILQAPEDHVGHFHPLHSKAVDHLDEKSGAEDVVRAIKRVSFFQTYSLDLISSSSSLVSSYSFPFPSASCSSRPRTSTTCTTSGRSNTFC